MDSRDYTSHMASTRYDEEDELAEAYPSLITLGLRVLTILFGLFILLPLVLFSPVALAICALVDRRKEPSVKEQPIIEITTIQPGPKHPCPGPSVAPASIEEIAVEWLAG